MRRIIIKVPRKQEKWKVSNYKRVNAASALRLIEKIIPRFTIKEKTCVRVNYGGGYNETLSSFNYKYLMYATICFLEDYISAPTKKKLERKYMNYGEIS
jgi:hypothetical protein